MSISDVISRGFRGISVRSKDILSFCVEDLHLTLFPTQIFIFKLFYGLPLSDDKVDNCIIIRDRFSERVLYEFCERDFLDFLYKSNRINVSSTDGVCFTNIFFCIGRRGTKTTMTSIITLFTLYQILLLDNPHKYFDILEEDEISVAIVSNSKDNADRQFRGICKMVYNSPFFIKHLSRDPSNGRLFLKSNRILDGGRGGHGSRGDILLNTFAANPNVRGSSNIVTISDEFAHFIDSDISTKDKPLDKLVFEALTPSTSGFIGEDGLPVGKNFFISSPNGRKGVMYDIYKSEMDGGTDGFLVLNLPSNWVNLKLSSHNLRSFHSKSELSFEQEYEAKFIMGSSGWLGDIKDRVDKCVDRGRDGDFGVCGRHRYFVGLDLGLDHDGTAIAVAHYEGVSGRYESLSGEFCEGINNVVVVDYIGYLLPDSGGYISLDDVFVMIDRVFDNYSVVDGSFDQFSGNIFMQLLSSRGYGSRLRKVPATQQSNSDYAKLFKQLLNEGRLLLPNKPDFLEELYRLRESVGRDGMIRVEDRDYHDDQYDAVSRAVWLCYNDRSSNLDSYNSNKYYGISGGRYVGDSYGGGFIGGRGVKSRVAVKNRERFYF